MHLFSVYLVGHFYQIRRYSIERNIFVTIIAFKLNFTNCQTSSIYEEIEKVRMEFSIVHFVCPISALI